ncbi:MAG: molybdopterin-dependent oxidoreductase [Acidimicrobiales bacterium]|nr:molybdopterin-dependent oxidoreductase [Acidimicrobiales bacterium]MYB82254.1 molybdopterin-dependent oxidoreductase [Acidimicrobiales bacterium]MYI11358.1 molybdopterin-dependent oxidoreductase [Acidimicrobiales bacterium]
MSERRTSEQSSPPGPAASPAASPAMHLGAAAPHDQWHDWSELDAAAWPERVERNYTLVPTTCFNCEAACGLVAYIDRDTDEVVRFEGNPEHPASRGRNCAKGPATINQVHDTERILYPLRRTGERGGGGWERVSWDEALTAIAARIRTAIVEGRRDEVMYHVGRPGEDGYTERVLTAWGVDGHNSHTNVCSSSARVGYATWMGHDRPSSDFANAEVIFLISSHLEAGHYFNPHAQRIIEAQQRGATVICVDPRLSNTGAKADHWLPAWPGTEPVLLLSLTHLLLEAGTWDRAFVHRWTNWQTYLAETRPDLPPAFESVEVALRDAYAEYTPERAAELCGVDADDLREIAHAIGGALGRFASHNWRAAGAGNLGGWQTARCLFLLNVLTGSVGTVGGTTGAGWHKMKPAPPLRPPPVEHWNELSWPREYPLCHHEMSILLPHFLREGRGKLDTYFTRVYNPVWTNPDGFSWLEALSDPERVGCHVALTPTWSETAWFADYVLPMGVGSERHDLASFETHAGQWLGFRQPVMRRYAELRGAELGPDSRTHEFNPGEVWEENEFWIDLSWRIDPDGSLGIRQWFESPSRPGEPIGIDEYYEAIFADEVPGLADDAAAAGQTPLEFMRDRGAYAVRGDPYGHHERVVQPAQLAGTVLGDDDVHRPSRDTVRGAAASLPPLGDGSVAVQVAGAARQGFPTPSRKLELYSTTLAEWGWPEHATPGWIPSHVHWQHLDLAGNERILVPTFRIPTLIHTRSANAKWLAEISHRHPLWIHPSDAEALGIEMGGLVRISTRIGHFVISAWRTEGIRPGVVAASHHMGRWRLDPAENAGGPAGRADGGGPRSWAGGPAEIDRDGTTWTLRRRGTMTPFASEDPDSERIWWNDTGVHQNLTFSVQPDPISGMQCWHQRVRVGPAEPGDRYGDVVVDTALAREAYAEWLAMTRPAPGPGGLRRPTWLARPLKPTSEAYRFDLS